MQPYVQHSQLFNFTGHYKGHYKSLTYISTSISFILPVNWEISDYFPLALNHSLNSQHFLMLIFFAHM